MQPDGPEDERVHVSTAALSGSSVDADQPLRDHVARKQCEVGMTAELGALAVSLILIAALIYSIKLYMEV